MNFLDLFSGIGGFRRGLERSGHKCTGHVEIDKYANQSYMAMYRLVPCKFEGSQETNIHRMGKKEVCENCDSTKRTGNERPCGCEWYAKDIKRITAGEIPKAQIWTFGFPCTDISLAGKREGLRGKRSGLFFTVTGLLKSTPDEDKPETLIIENVKNLVSSEGGGAFTTVLTELWESGYDAEWQIVNSKNFGVPQSRERVYLVGYLRGTGRRKVFPIGGTNRTTLKEIVGGWQGKRVYDPAGLAVTLCAQGGGMGGRTGLYLCETRNDPEQLMKCLQFHVIKEENQAAKDEKQNINKESEMPCTKSEYSGFFSYKKEPDMTEKARCLVSHYHSGITRFGESSGVMHCHVCDKDCNHTAECRFLSGLPIREATKQGYVIANHGDGINLSYPNSSSRRGRVGKQCSQTILTGGAMGVMIYCRIRRLTPRECWRLQAFEDFLFDRARAAGISDAQLYKQAGNAVTVNVVYEIGVRLQPLAGGGFYDRD